MEENSKLERSYKYLEDVLKPFINTVRKNVPELLNSFTAEELHKIFIEKYYECLKEILENLLNEQDKFYTLLIEAGRPKELLANNIGEIELKITIDCATAKTLGKSLDLMIQEYIVCIINYLTNRVKWLVNEYNDLNYDKKYEIKDKEGNIIT